MPRISSPRPLDLTKPFVTSSQSYGSQPFDLSRGLVTWYRDIEGDFVPDLSGRGNTARCGGIGSNDRVTGSNDIPEYNPLNYPIRSFDLTSNDTSPNVQHIRSVNDSGTATSYEDHTFTDGTQDIPFSVSFWVKLDTTSGAQYIISKGSTTSGQYEWSIYNSNNTLTVNLFSQGEVADRLRATLASAFPGSRNGWDHFVITYDGESSILCYRNGSSQTLTLVNSSFSSMKTSSYGLFLGAGFQYPDLRSDDLQGKLHSISIWKNRVINQFEALELYNAYVNGPGGEARSGFISRSPRLLLQELDDHAGSYSTVQRTGDTSRPGTLATNFDDSTTIIFSETGSPVFPSMLPRGNTFNSQAVDILGQESDISITAPIRSAQHPTYLHYSPEEQMGPFNENRVMPATDFFLSGTNPDVMPGFTSPLRSKIAIEIDITPQSDTLVMKNVDRRTVAEGGASIGDKTGFLYYNFVRKEWEQIGLKDPATGGALYFDYAIDTFPSNNLSGTFPSQFASTWPQADQSKSFRDQQGYTKIGTPNAAFQAPFKEIYHATASQGLKLSDYINAPFMLEKVKVEFEEINAQRKQGNLPSANASSGSNRDIDNYVFFAYRQSRKNRVVDSVSDVSSSERFIIFSGSMSFWNSPSFSTSPIDEAVLSHSPAFSYDFNLPFDNVFRTGQFTGSVSMELTPAVTPRQSSGLVYLWNPDFAIAGAHAAGVRNFWGGGTSCKKFVQNWNVNTFIFTDPFSNFSLVSIDALEPNLDQRSFRKVGSETNSGTTFTLSSVPVFINSENASSAESPYLLLPEDEIIFGLDCGVTPFGGAKTFSSITGSQMTISRKPCKITLFGSMVIDGIEKLPCLNQNLSSNSVHEIIGAEPVLDQFQIEPISSYYGSYLDNIITGSMATPSANTTLFTIFNQDNSRRIISRVSLGQAGTTGSLQRFVKMIDQSERTYDSCLPDIFTFVSQSDIGLTGSLIYIGQGVFDDSVNEYAKFLPNQFPFFGNPKRTIETDKATYLQSEPAGGDGIEAYSSILNGLARMKDLVFRTDWKIKKRASFYPDPMAHRFKNSTESAASQRPFSSGTFRYGISNIDPEFSSVRWSATSFGQLRDMLEPRLGVTTSDGASPVKIHFVSGSTYNADPNNTHAQNISTFATSSIPWIDDGLFRNREDNPDETLLIF